MRSMAQIVRITLFPPNANRVSQLVNSYVLDEHGVLHYRDSDGTEYQTTIPYVIEHLEEGVSRLPLAPSSRNIYAQLPRLVYRIGTHSPSAGTVPGNSSNVT